MTGPWIGIDPGATWTGVVVRFGNRLLWHQVVEREGDEDVIRGVGVGAVYLGAVMAALTEAAQCVHATGHQAHVAAEGVVPPNPRERRFHAFVDIELDTADPFMPTREAALQVARWTHGAHIVGAVPNFDSEVLANLLRDYGLIPAWHYHLIDVETLAVGWLHGRESADVGDGYQGPPWKSDELSRLCDVEPPTDDERHTAMGDAEWAMRWYDAITGAKA